MQNAVILPPVNNIPMADNFLERQYAAYEERKRNLGKPRPKSSVKFYTRPGKPKDEGEKSSE